MPSLLRPTLSVLSAVFLAFPVCAFQSPLSEESVREAYCALIHRLTGSRSGSAVGYAPRPYDFWKGFDVQVFNGDEQRALKPSSSFGDPNFSCSEGGGCTLTGATLYFEFPADAFSSS